MQENLRKLVLSLLVCVSAISGCITLANPKTSPTALLINGSVENSELHHYIQDVPFVGQKGNLCGPAALSSIFKYYNRDVSQEEIAREIYLIPAHGVLNLDLENYAKDRGLWTQVSYDSDLSKIKENIRRDIPVLVLVESSSVPFKTTYHYLVLLGYEDDEKVFIAHSGKSPNQIIPYRTFSADWARAEFWSLIVCPKEKIDWDLDGPGYNKLGVLFEKEGKFDLAIEKYKKSLEKSKSADTLFNMGNAYLKKKEYKKAIPFYNEALVLNPKFADCYNNLAYTYMEEDVNLDEAVKYAEEALRLKPANKAYYLDTLGMIQLKKDQPYEAIKSFEEASALIADKKMNSLIYYHLGLARLKAGVIEEAKEALQKSIELDPASEAKETLKDLL